MSHAPELQPCAGEYAMTVVFIRNREDDLNCGVRERYAGFGLSDDELLALQLRDELREAYENSNIAGRFVVKALINNAVREKLIAAAERNLPIAKEAEQ